MKKNMNWIKLITFQIAIIFILLNVLSLPLLGFGWGMIPYTEKFIIKWNSFKRENFNYTHPYLGYTRYKFQDVKDIKFDSNLIWEDFKTINYDEKKHPTILILGGSLAAHFSNNQDSLYLEKSFGKNAFSRSLKKEYSNSNFRVINAAYGGKKQPQQYLTAIYLDLLGLKYDLVINVDGFNEIALTSTENFNQNIPGIFPRSYFKHLSAFENGRKCINSFNKKISYIPFWDFVNSVKIRMCLVNITNPEKVFDSLLLNKNIEKYIKESIEIWSRSSNKLYKFLSENEIYYIHTIQPSQYLKNSKPLSKKELEFAYKNNLRAKMISDYYLQLDISNLEAKNITDLRFIFENEKQTLYRDVCCHLNDVGLLKAADKIILDNKQVFDKLMKSN